MGYFLDEKPALDEYLARCAEVPGVAVQDVYDEAVAGIYRLKNGNNGNETPLWNRWYQSIKAGNPDWSIYDSDAYLGDLWACWTYYSRRYLRAIREPSSLPEAGGVVADIGPVGMVADLGCGVGCTTAGLRELFPSAEVVGTNIAGTKQMDICLAMARTYGFAMASDMGQHADVVFASEYFEHFPRPVDHLVEVLDTLTPHALLVANTFTNQAIGHFDSYRVDGKELAGIAVSRRFNDALRTRGYRQVATKLWNHRPAYWKRYSY